ncbi:hypothetical protein OK016_28800 [Vibrio chagasii]|nr:hypothetical protein [Vibrio chagasii]
MVQASGVLASIGSQILSVLSTSGGLVELLSTAVWHGLVSINTGYSP